MSSVYICEYISDMSLEDAFAAYGDECIEAFAAFVVRLHKAVSGTTTSTVPMCVCDVPMTVSSASRLSTSTVCVFTPKA